MSFIDADLAVLIIVVWTLLRDFFLAPVLVRVQLQRHANQLAESFIAGLGAVLSDPAKATAVKAIVFEIIGPELKEALSKFAKGGGLKPPSPKDMFVMGIAYKLGLWAPPGSPGGGPGLGEPPGQGALPAPQEGPRRGPKSALFGGRHR